MQHARGAGVHYTPSASEVNAANRHHPKARRWRHRRMCTIADATRARSGLPGAVAATHTDMALNSTLRLWYSSARRHDARWSRSRRAWACTERSDGVSGATVRMARRRTAAEGTTYPPRPERVSFAAHYVAFQTLLSLQALVRTQVTYMRGDCLATRATTSRGSVRRTSVRSRILRRTTVAHPVNTSAAFTCGRLNTTCAVTHVPATPGAGGEARLSRHRHCRLTHTPVTHRNHLRQERPPQR